MINRTLFVKRPDLVSLKPSPNLTVENPWHSQPEMMKFNGRRNSICFFWINCMSEGKKMKLVFHVVVTNYCGNLVVSSIILDATTCFAIGSMSTLKCIRITIPDYNRALRPIPIPPKSFSNVIPSLGGVQMISWRSIGLIGSPWLSMFSKLNRVLMKGLWVALNLCKTSGPCWMSVGTTFKLLVAWV